jgi:hypothetical protein
MAIQNRKHVRGVHDLIHGAIQEFVAENGLEKIAASDVACAIAWVLRDVIKQAPNAQVRGELAAGARYAIDDAGKSSIILPAS